jgi:uncharacterized YccA/Bax inhibitor family protein
MTRDEGNHEIDLADPPMTREDVIEKLRFYLVVIAVSSVTVVAWALFVIAYPRTSVGVLVFAVVMLYRWERWLK